MYSPGMLYHAAETADKALAAFCTVLRSFGKPARYSDLLRVAAISRRSSNVDRIILFTRPNCAAANRELTRYAKSTSRISCMKKYCTFIFVSPVYDVQIRLAGYTTGLLVKMFKTLMTVTHGETHSKKTAAAQSAVQSGKNCRRGSLVP